MSKRDRETERGRDREIDRERAKERRRDMETERETGKKPPYYCFFCQGNRNMPAPKIICQ